MTNTNSIKFVYQGGQMSNTYVPCSAVITIDEYATGGIKVPWGTFKPEIIVGCEVVDGTTKLIPSYDMVSGKLKLFSALGTEASPGSVTKIAIHLTAFGTQ